jgi:MMP alpha-(1->4)-mannosyltransferase
MPIIDNDKPLRICLLGYRSHPHCGGQGVYIKNLSRALIGLGHTVHVVSGPPYPELDNDIPLFQLPSLDLYNPEDPFRMPSYSELKAPINLIEWLGISAQGFPEPLTFGMRANRFLKNRLTQYDVVHDNQSLSYGIQEIGRRFPTVATIHHPMTVDRKIAVRSIWKKMQLWRWYSFIYMQKRVARSLNRILTVSECARKDLSREFKIPAHKIHVVPNGIDVDRFYPLPEVSRERNRIIVTNSADVPLKGLYYLLRAVANVSKKRDVQLTVIGAANGNGRVGKWISELGIDRRVTFTGWVDHDEFVQHYARASVAVVPSVYEGFGLPAGEAMASGVPVVSTTGGALPEVVGDAGILVPTANPDALGAAIERVLSNPSYAADLGQAGYKRVHRHFTWRRAGEKTISQFRETIRDYGQFRAS